MKKSLKGAGSSLRYVTPKRPVESEFSLLVLVLVLCVGADRKEGSGRSLPPSPHGLWTVREGKAGEGGSLSLYFHSTARSQQRAAQPSTRQAGDREGALEHSPCLCCQLLLSSPLLCSTSHRIITRYPSFMAR